MYLNTSRHLNKVPGMASFACGWALRSASSLTSSRLLLQDSPMKELNAAHHGTWGRRPCIPPFHASSGSVPEMEPFNRSPLNRNAPRKSILELAEQQLLDRCERLEGDAAYECWQAYFEFESQKAQSEHECALAEPGQKQAACQGMERLQSTVRQSAGVTNLIKSMRLAAKVEERARKAAQDRKKAMEREHMLSEFELTDSVDVPSKGAALASNARPSVNEASAEEMENRAAVAGELGTREREAKGVLQDVEVAADSGLELSPFERVLRKRGLSGGWYRQRIPDDSRGVDD